MTTCFTCKQKQNHTPNCKFLQEKRRMLNDHHLDVASTSRCNKQLLQQRKNHTVTEKSSDRRRKAEIKQLEGRLRILEEEAEMLKGALLESVEESKKIIADIHLQFSTIQNCILQRELGIGESCSHAIQVVSHQKDRRAGLLQILCQESNPSIVNKGLRTKSLLEDSELSSLIDG